MTISEILQTFQLLLTLFGFYQINESLKGTKGLDGGMRYDFIPKNQNIISDRVIDITDIAEKISSADETLQAAAELMIYKIKNHGLSPEINTITTEIVNNSETISTVIETLSK